MKLRVLDLFSGIGGFSLGLKRAGGFKTVCYVEIEPYCQEVLKARGRDGTLDLAPIWDDITKFDGKPWRGCADVVTGGFPCQDISIAGSKKGLDGERSGLWFEMERIIGEVRPRFVVVENSSALTDRGGHESLTALPDSGMTQNGELFQLARLVPRTYVNVSGFWPTPCLPGNGGSHGKKKLRRLLETIPTPNATAFKGGRLSPRKGRSTGERNNYQDFCSLALKMRYLLPEFGEQIMGFPLGWTYVETWASGTPSSRKSQSGSGDESKSL